jgi:AmmeMemoRadiSam system protein B/AmmeMemoRadiSam system protein A
VKKDTRNKLLYAAMILILIGFAVMISVKHKTANSADSLKANLSPADIRNPAVAGQFYPEDPGELGRAVRYYLDDAVVRSIESPVALIVPHAGYVFSGQIAADAFKQVEGKAISTVIILGTNHTTAGFNGASIWPRGAFRTPLGDALIDEDMAEKLMAANDKITFRRELHTREHSIEVQVPFIQTVLPNAKIVPMVIGSADLDICRTLGHAIASVAKSKPVLIVASSDLSHYPTHDGAVLSDTHVLQAVTSMEPLRVIQTISEEMNRGTQGLSTCACGEGPILTAMVAAKELDATHAIVVSHANSGDTPLGEMDRVVGYGAVILARGQGETDVSALTPIEPTSAKTPLSAEQKRYLLDLARRTIDRYLTTSTVPLARPKDAALYAKRGAFVTLTDHGRLRGCIGHMVEDQPFCQVVSAMALQAAFNDRRFQPVTEAEWKNLSIEISALTPYQKIDSPDRIVIGRDGVLLRKGGYSAVYLPQVATEQGWNRDEMLMHLCEKAGLTGDCWKKDTEFFIFQAEVFHEGE